MDDGASSGVVFRPGFCCWGSSLLWPAAYYASAAGHIFLRLGASKDVVLRICRWSYFLALRGIKRRRITLALIRPTFFGLHREKLSRSCNRSVSQFVQQDPTANSCYHSTTEIPNWPSSVTMEFRLGLTGRPRSKPLWKCLPSAGKEPL